jgi:hypothetical protein
LQLIGDRMLRNLTYRHIYTRLILCLVYLSFFLVQFNVHIGDVPPVSFFTGDFNAPYQNNISKNIRSKNICSDSRPVYFRLNKRFHPEDHFVAPEKIQDLVKFSFGIRVVLLNDTQPLTSYLFNSPSLRGPPAVV